MEQETIYLPSKLHALMMRVCTKKNLTASQMLENAMRREIAAELPLAKLIVKKAAEMQIKVKGGAK
jgi:fructose-bisphosphate aldolase class 1